MRAPTRQELRELWLDASSWLLQLWWKIPGTWRAQLTFAEWCQYGSWKKRREALDRLDAFYEQVLRDGSLPLSPPSDPPPTSNSIEHPPAG